MASLTLDRDECAEGFLPPVCARCGEPATGTRVQKFQWYPLALNFLIFCCLPLYFVLLFVFLKRTTVALPFCERHLGFLVRRRVAMIAGIFSMHIGIYVGTLFGPDIDRLVNFDSSTPIAIFVGVIVGIVLLSIAGFKSIRPTRITNDTITLKGLSPVFADTVEQYRILIEDEEE